MGYQSMLRDIGMHATVTLYSDSSAARGIIHRTGLGKLRHLETGYLRLQAAVAKKSLSVPKVNGAEKPADLFTEYLLAADMWKHSESDGARRRTIEDGANDLKYSDDEFVSPCILGAYAE